MTDTQMILPLDDRPRYLSRRFASAKEILGDAAWGDLLAEFTETMEETLDLFLNAILTLPDRPPLAEVQAHIILGELIETMFGEA
jgi:hypothetical protein